MPGVVENVTLPLPLSHFFLPVVENGTLEGKPMKKSFVHNILIPNFAPNLQIRFLPHQGSRTGQEPSATVESEFKIQDANIFALTYFQNFCLQ